MKSCVGLAISLSLICSVLALAQSNSSSATQSPAPSASASAASTKLSLGGIDVLSDTTGADIDNYLRSSVKIVKQNWCNLSPPIARAPRMMRGEVVISFEILKSGKVVGMSLEENSSDVSLDRAAWEAITSSKWSPLPAEFSSPFLKLRFHFIYNPAKSSDAVLQYREGTRL